MGLRIERSKKGYREDRTAYDYRMYANHQIATPTENWLLANATRYFAFVILAKEGERKAFAWFNFSTLCHCTNVFAFFGLVMFCFLCACCLFVGGFFALLCWLLFSTLLQLPPISLSFRLCPPPSLSLPHSLFSLALSCSFPLTAAQFTKSVLLRVPEPSYSIFVLLFGFLLCYLHWCHRFVRPFPSTLFSPMAFCYQFRNCIFGI